MTRTGTDVGRVWQTLDSAPVGRRVPGTVPVFVLGCLAGALASVYTVRTGTNLDYGDAMAHLTISRRVFDSKVPGLAQLGTVWLPVPHLLLLPLVQNLWLFRTGIAGCIVGSLCLGATSAALYRVLARLGVDGLGRIVGLAVLIANPSLLYVSSTALTEPVLLASIGCCVAGLAGWATSTRRLSGGELAVFAGIPLAAGVMTRYEAWPLAISGAVFVAAVSWRRGDVPRRVLAYVVAFVGPTLLATAWWLAYNLATYGNPLEFLNGQYSASQFTRVFLETGQLTTKGNFGLSLHVYGWAMLETSGAVVMVLAAVGLVVMTWRWGLQNRALLVWLGGTSSAFLVFALTTGQHVLINDRSMPTGAYNNRNALSASPWLALLEALLIGAWLGHRRLRMAATVVVLLALAAQNLWWFQAPYDRMAVLQEGHDQHVAYEPIKQAALWLNDHYDGGGLLMDQSPDKSSVAPVLGLELNQVYVRSEDGYFLAALADPYDHVRWVFMHTSQLTNIATHNSGDLVTEALMFDPQFHAEYQLVYAIDDLGIYRRIGDA